MNVTLIYLFIIFIMTGCLSTSKKGEKGKEFQSSDASDASISYQDADEFLVSECYLIFKDTRYIYNFYQDSNNLKRGSIYALEPVPPLIEPYYEIEYESQKTKILIRFKDFEDTLEFELNISDWQGYLIEKHKNKKTKFTCEEFLI